MRSQRWVLLAVLALLTLGATDGSGSRKVCTFATVRSCRVPHAHRWRVQADLKVAAARRLGTCASMRVLVGGLGCSCRHGAEPRRKQGQSPNA